MLEQKLRSQLKIDRTFASGETADSVEGIAREDGIDLLADEALFYIDGGRNGGAKPSAQEIYKWYKAKGLQPRRDGQFSSRGGISKARGFEGKLIQDVRASYAIANSIGRFGTIKRYGYKGSGIIDFVFNSIEPEMREAISLAFLEKITNTIDEELEDGNTNQ